MGGRPGGWLVPNNDIGYLICNRRQYRLATPHFIPPLPPSSSTAPRLALLSSFPSLRHSLYLYRYTIPARSRLRSLGTRTPPRTHKGVHTHTRAHTQRHTGQTAIDTSVHFRGTRPTGRFAFPLALSPLPFLAPPTNKPTVNAKCSRVQFLWPSAPYSQVPTRSPRGRGEKKRREEKRGTESESRDDEETR